MVKSPSWTYCGTFCQDGVRLHDVSCSAEKPTVCEEAATTRLQETSPKATTIHQTPTEATQTKPKLSPQPTRFFSSSRQPSLSTSRSPKSLPASSFSPKTTFLPSFSSRPSSDFLFQPASTSSNSAKPPISSHSLFQPHIREQLGPFSTTFASTSQNITDTALEVRTKFGVESIFQIFLVSGHQDWCDPRSHFSNVWLRY